MVMVVKLACPSRLPGGLVETLSAEPAPEFLIQWESVFLTSPQVMLLLLSGDHTLRTTVLGQIAVLIIHGPEPLFLEWLLMAECVKGQK